MTGRSSLAVLVAALSLTARTTESADSFSWQRVLRTGGANSHQRDPWEARITKCQGSRREWDVGRYWGADRRACKPHTAQGSLDPRLFAHRLSRARCLCSSTIHASNNCPRLARASPAHFLAFSLPRFLASSLADPPSGANPRALSFSHLLPSRSLSLFPSYSRSRTPLTPCVVRRIGEPSRGAHALYALLTFYHPQNLALTLLHLPPVWHGPSASLSASSVCPPLILPRNPRSLVILFPMWPDAICRAFSFLLDETVLGSPRCLGSVGARISLLLRPARYTITIDRVCVKLYLRYPAVCYFVVCQTKCVSNCKDFKLYLRNLVYVILL